jgi:Icc-related predicted phosphoesterase
MDHPKPILRAGHEPKAPNTVRFVCISDTHNLTDQLGLPPGDVLIHAGDFSMIGSPDQVRHFDDFLARQPHPVKVAIAGNHEITFDIEKYQAIKGRFPLQNVPDPMMAKGLLRHCTYLEDTQTHAFGYTITGSPWVDCSGWGFHCDTEAEIASKWAKIPTHTDILVTHSPPYRVLDADLHSRKPMGCPHLLTRVREIRPIVHVFGHMHEGYGAMHTEQTLFINVSVCNYDYRPVNPPTVFDLPIR